MIGDSVEKLECKISVLGTVKGLLLDWDEEFICFALSKVRQAAYILYPKNREIAYKCIDELEQYIKEALEQGYGECNTLGAGLTGRD